MRYISSDFQIVEDIRGGRTGKLNIHDLGMSRIPLE